MRIEAYDRSGADLIEQVARMVEGAEYDAAAEVVLQRLVEAAARNVPGADHAGVTVLERHGVTSDASTDGLVRRLDRVQQDLGEGPCVDAARTQRMVRIDDTSAEERWPRFTPVAADMGVASMLSIQLFAGRSVSAALNLYSMRARAFTAESEDLAVMLAAPTGVAVTAVYQIENLRVALESRDVIGRAKGILMERYKITDQQAFDLLVMVSQRSNRKLREVADDLSATGDLPIPAT